MRDVNGLKGLHVLRTMNSTKKRSIPRIHNSAYLDLYMLSKEKERLLKERERLGLRDTVVKKRLEAIDAETNELQKAEVAVGSRVNRVNPSSLGSNFTQKDGVKKEWKKMTLNY
jgi:hypothetical protein